MTTRNTGKSFVQIKPNIMIEELYTKYFKDILTSRAMGTEQEQ